MHELLKGSIAISSQPKIDTYSNLFSPPNNLILGQEAYLIIGYHLFSLRERDITIRSPNDLAPHKIGILLNNVISENAKKEIFTTPVKETKYSNSEQLVKGLFSRRVDLIVGSKAIIYEAMSDMALNPDDIKPVYKVGLTKRYLIFSESNLGENAIHLRDQTDKAIKQLRESGAINAIIEKHAPPEWYDDTPNN
jgi:ABC-type amino acid transport substrate-binding protein